jgi:signal transduction histidine kinase
MLLRRKIRSRHIVVKAICCLCLLFYCLPAVVAQQAPIGTLYAQFKAAKDDSARYVTGFQLYSYYEEINRDSALYFADYGLGLARKNDRRLNIVISLSQRAYQLLSIGKYSECLQNLLDAYTIAEDPASEKYGWVNDTLGTPHKRRLYGLAYAHGINGVLMSRIQNTEQEIFHFSVSKELAIELNNPIRLCLATMNIGKAYLTIKQYDSTLLYEQAAEDISIRSGFTKFLGFIYYLKGIVYLNRKDTSLAKQTFYKAISWGESQSHYAAFAASNYELARIYLNQNRTDSALYYAINGLHILQQLHASFVYGYTLANAYELLGQVYRLVNRSDSAQWYQARALQAKDSIYNDRINNLSAFHNLTLKETLRLQDVEKEKKIYQQRVRNYGLLIGIAVLLLVMFFLFRNNRQRSRTNRNLYAAQSQLLQKNRELEVETGLDKVRVATMSMEKSEDLLSIITVVAAEMEKLGVRFEAVNFRINVHQSDWDLWVYAKWMDQPMRWFVPRIDHPYFDVKEIDGAVVPALFTIEQKRSFDAYLTSLGLIKPSDDPVIIEQQRVAFEEAKAFTMAIATAKDVSLNITNSDGRMSSPEENAILLRFVIVFEQAYTRFLDLQKAEAQAREAQIEAALERVRSRAMAMQHSDELKGLISTIFVELSRLDFVLTRCTLMLFDRETKDCRWWMVHAEKPSEQTSFLVPWHEHPPQLSIAHAWETQALRWEYVLEGKTKKEWDDFLFSRSELAQLPSFVIDGMRAPDKVLLSGSFNSFGGLNVASLEPLPEELFAILIRFAKVFELSYTRFNDLKQAEAQAREAQIQLSLERVRAKTMSMHESKDLLEVINVLSEQFIQLGFKIDSANFNTSYRDKDWNLWLYNPGTPLYPEQIHIPYIDHPYFNRTIKALERGEEFTTLVFEKKDKDSFLDHLYDHTIAGKSSEERKKYCYDAKGFAWSVVYLKNTAVTIANYDAEPYTEEQNAILRKFGTAFEQSYTRFLDLQKAEAQARESQIEAALEKIRSSSLAMHRSEDLKQVISVIFEKTSDLKVLVGSGSVAIQLFDEQARHFYLWLDSPHQDDPIKIYLPYNEKLREKKGLLKDCWDTWLSGRDLINARYTNEEVTEYFEYVFANNDLDSIPQDKGCGLVACMLVEKNSCLYADSWNGEQYGEENLSVLKRIAKVFDQAYIRFLDLQKAEAQAREAQIEAGLERVRYSAMAMQSSEDVASATAIMFNEISLLGVEAMRCGITVIYPDRTADVWAATTTAEGKEMKGMGSINFGDHPLWIGLFDAWKNKEEYYSYALQGEDLHAYYQALADSPNYDSSYIQKQNMPDQVFYARFFEQGAVFTFSLQPHNEEKRRVLKNFTAVFALTFRRYLDLKQAEAQAREAEIQLSLERVRARTMAMQRSEELAETSELLFEEYQKLRLVKGVQAGTAADRATIGLFNEPNRTYDLWLTGLTGKKLEHTFQVSFDEPVNIVKVYKAWKEGKSSLVVDMQGEQLNQWFDHLQSIGLPVSQDLYGKRRVNHYAFFSKGNLGISTNEPLTAEGLDLLQRFADTFNITYTRFLDLKDAEARAQEAVKEASLDRVRAEIASMRTAVDLQRITPLVWRELTALGVPFLRCGVFIVDDAKGRIQFYLSSPDGKSLAVLDQPFDESDVTLNVTNHWRKQEMYSTHWDKEAFLKFAQGLVDQGQVTDVRQYQGGDKTPELLTLQFLPFAQGMMYVGSAEDLSVTQLALVQTLADAFSTAYARYEDFVQLEAANEQIESTLRDLRATQTQLVQSEKMASLGELTAGIAHEIQNPLNFVNNFAEVSAELLDEMKEALATGNPQLATEIAQDVKENLEKINHHGKRADGIVKGMLQHSRSSTGQKESTDINALCDEYLRLAYHGLRAKDKSFNASFETDFDASTGKINIQPQEIGRVVLNLINNAFYAVTERKQKSPEGYQPRVIVRTKKTPDAVLITVEDNGTGIPQKVLDKIFQPFFTTKPTGKGTGLGLSLSYDIVKTHGGELSAMNGEAGAVFRIKLPNH